MASAPVVIGPVRGSVGNATEEDKAATSVQSSNATVSFLDRTLAGLVLAARGEGDTTTATEALAQLQRNFHAADPGALETLMSSFDRRRPQ